MNSLGQKESENWLSRAKAEADKAKREAAALRAKLAADKRAEALKTRTKMAAEKAKAAEKPVVKYVLKEGDTWTHVSLKFYGHATEPYWRPIYEANKEMVGDDYRRIRPGMEIIIPEMPEELKDK